MVIKKGNYMELKDSGTRREFETGAVRDRAEGKGRCDLLPLDVVGDMLCEPVLVSIDKYIYTGRIFFLEKALHIFVNDRQGMYGAMLEVSKHFEAGAVKYNANNWRKGIPISCYIDSAVRHFLKHRSGQVDEPHDRAFMWNVLCAIWTIKNKPEMNDIQHPERDGGLSA